VVQPTYLEMHEEWSGISCRFPGSLFIFRYRQTSDLNAKQAWGLYPQNLWPIPLWKNKNFRKIWKEKTPYQANRTNQLADPSRYILHPVYLVFGQASSLFVLICTPGGVRNIFHVYGWFFIYILFSLTAFSYVV